MKKLLFVIAALTMITPAKGADFDVYGKINMGVWYMDFERFYDDTINVVVDVHQDTIGDSVFWVYDSTITMGSDSMDMIVSDWIPFGTIGLKFTSDRFGGCIEMGVHGNLYDSRLGGSITHFKQYRKYYDFITMKRWYAEWYINDIFTLLFGKAVAPTNFSPSNQVFWAGYGFNNIGCLSTGSSPMFQLGINALDGGIEGKLAVIKPDTTTLIIRNATAENVSYQSSAKLPKFEAGFKYSIEKDNFSTYGNFAGGFQRYESVLFSTSTIKDSSYLEISSWVVGCDLGIKIGPVSLALDAFYGENIGIYGVFVGDEFGWWRTHKYMSVFYPKHVHVENKGWELQNGQAFEAAAILTIKPLDLLAFEGGVGTVIGTHENPEYDAHFHNTIAWYGQIELTILGLLRITPEVGRYDYGPLLGFGRYTYWGLNTGIDF